MRIFSNFDTTYKARTIQEYQKKYGKGNIIILRKSGLFLREKFLIPALINLITCTLVSISLFNLRPQGFRYAFIFIFLVFFFLFSQSIKYLIDYCMDFSIVSHDSFTRFNQSGFFRRDESTSSARNIKTICINKNKLLYSLFNNGDLVFLSEAETSGKSGEITLHHIKDPEKKRKQIVEMMKASRVHPSTL